jgi:hypothetical protein
MMLSVRERVPTAYEAGNPSTEGAFHHGCHLTLRDDANETRYG